MKWPIGFLLSWAFSAAILAGCEDSGTQPPLASISGELVVLDTFLPVQAKVALVDGRSFTIVAGPVATDATGRYRMSGLPAGMFYLFIFSGQYVVLEPSSVK